MMEEQEYQQEEAGGAMEDDGMSTMGTPIAQLEVRARPSAAVPRPTRSPVHRCVPPSAADRAARHPAQGQNGISSADVKKLTDAGIHTVETLAHSSKKDLLGIKGLSEPKCEKMLGEGASSTRERVISPLLLLAAACHPPPPATY